MALCNLALTAPFFALLSLVVACGGGIESAQSDSPLNGKPGGGSSSGSSGGGSSGGGSSSVGGSSSGGGSNSGGCGAIPRCDAGDQEVASSSACLQDDARCYPRPLSAGWAAQESHLP